jgi:hypothetical protein
MTPPLPTPLASFLAAPAVGASAAAAKMPPDWLPILLGALAAILLAGLLLWADLLSRYRREEEHPEEEAEDPLP